MFVLESQVNRMLPLIERELECVDRNHAKLTQLSTSLVEAINMYHMLMSEGASLAPAQFYPINPLYPAQQYGFQSPPSQFFHQNQNPDTFN